MAQTSKHQINTWNLHLPTEKSLQAKIIKDLESRDIFNFKVITANKRGVPDIVCCINGRFVALEIKRLTGLKNSIRYRHSQVAEIQKVKNAEISKSGGLAFFVDSFESYLLILKSLAVKVENG